MDTQINYHIPTNYLVVDNVNYEILKLEDNDIKHVYSYFVINRPDMSDVKFSFTQILVHVCSLDSRCFLKRVDMIYAKNKDGIQWTTIKEAIA